MERQNVLELCQIPSCFNIDYIKVVCSGVFRKNVLVDHANLVLQMRTQLHD